ncbi:MAG TPA: DUF2293 domain-containing protein [Kofleriaceae bacterium]
MADSLTLAPTADPRVFVAPDGQRMSPPASWDCLPPGDAGLTRRVKAAGPSWAVIEKRGRKAFSRGLWAPRENIEAARSQLGAERSTEAYAKKRQSDVARRDRAQTAYAIEFEQEVVRFLAFSPRWAELGRTIGRLVAAHATPVGSGTVARTQRIEVHERAEAAVIAWMRHQTTRYDDMQIERVAGRRREVRRELAELSRAVLDLHRRELPHAGPACPLCSAVAAERSQAECPDVAEAHDGPRAMTPSCDGPVIADLAEQ